MNLKESKLLTKIINIFETNVNTIKNLKIPSFVAIRNFIFNTIKELSTSLWNKIKENGKIFLKIISILTLVYIAIYSLIVNNSLLGMMPLSIFSNDKVVYLILIILTFLLSRHLIRLKLVFWRIFLQTFLNTESLVYKFFSHGYLVRIIAIIVSFGLSIKILTFCTLLRVHEHQYIILCCGMTLYILMNFRSYNLKGYTFVRGDVNAMIKSYLMPFLIASATGMVVSAYEIMNVDSIQQIQNFSHALEISISQISQEHISWPLRVVVRHIYAYELIVQQILNIPVLGKPIYFVYIVVSEGVITFFSIFLLVMPYKKESKDANA